MILIQPESRGLGRGLCFAEIKKAEAKCYLGRIVYKIEASAQAVSSYHHFKQPLRCSTRPSGMWLWVRANLGQVGIIPCINIWIKAAIAATTLGAM